MCDVGCMHYSKRAAKWWPVFKYLRVTASRMDDASIECDAFSVNMTQIDAWEYIVLIRVPSVKTLSAPRKVCTACRKHGLHSLLTVLRWDIVLIAGRVRIKYFKIWGPLLYCKSYRHTASCSGVCTSPVFRLTLTTMRALRLTLVLNWMASVRGFRSFSF